MYNASVDLTPLRKIGAAFYVVYFYEKEIEGKSNCCLPYKTESIKLRERYINKTIKHKKEYLKSILDMKENLLDSNKMNIPGKKIKEMARKLLQYSKNII
ncbi:MAG: hypothetical protein SOY54_04025 [Bacilli bacterium]|nr:hypothetical protein [Bacilli bacterium]